jgi:hypothetical protein
MAVRSRKRNGNSSGGGFPLGQILGLSIGGGETNPAYGASGPGDVDPGYAGDPSKAIAKYGTAKPFTDLNAFQKFYGEDDPNKELALSNAKADAALKRLPKELEARNSADLTAKMDLANREDLKLAQDLALYQQQQQASNPGTLVPTLSPQEYRLGLGRRAEQIGIPSAQLLSHSDTQELGFRQSNPGLVDDSLKASFEAPGLKNEGVRLSNDAERRNLPLAGSFGQGNMRRWVTEDGTPGKILGYTPGGRQFDEKGNEIHTPDVPWFTDDDGNIIQPRRRGPAVEPQKPVAPKPSTSLTPKFNLSLPPIEQTIGAPGVGSAIRSLGSPISKGADWLTRQMYGTANQPTQAVNPAQPTAEQLLQKRAEQDEARKRFEEMIRQFQQ